MKLKKKCFYGILEDMYHSIQLIMNYFAYWCTLCFILFDPTGCNKDVALLVFHHKEAHALPSQTSDKILTGSDFNHLGTIIDLAFLSQKGIYECEMNTVGIERVVSFLLQYKTQKK